MPTRIVIGGAAGRMGREIAAAAGGDPEIQVVGGIVRAGGSRADLARASDRPAEVLVDADVLVEFTTPEVTLEHVAAAHALGKAAVVGTTGLTAAHLERLRSMGQQIPLLYSRNTSVGINTLLSILPRLAEALRGYDIEITEAHHRGKKDAPSGTALALAEAIAEALGTPLEAHATYGRHGLAPRQPGEIGIQAIRAGGNAGEHWVLFADEGEQIQIVHRAYSRRTFALGALRAAKWVASQPPGYYTMADMLK